MGNQPREKNMHQKEKTLFFSILFFTLAWHVFGHFFLYDIYNDEGEYLINAKNWSEFGILSLEGSYNTAIAPLNTFLHKIIFDIFSPSIAIARLLNLFFIMFTLALAYSFFRNFYNSKIVLSAFLILTVNGIFNEITTYAEMESKVFFFIFLSFICCFSSNHNIRRLAFVPFACALAFKPTYIYLFIPIMTTLILKNKIEGNRLLSRLNVLDVFLFSIGLGLFTFLPFFIAFHLDPVNFFEWGTRNAVANRVDPISVISDPLAKGLIPTLFYYFQRAPISLVLFFWGFAKALTSKNKSLIETFLILWVVTEILFYSVMPFVNPRYLLDLVFPLSILSVSYLTRTGKLEILPNVSGYKLIIISIVSFQIISSLLYFLWVKPLRPSYETIEWLQENSDNYETIMIPSQLSINIQKKTYTTSSDTITINQILNTQDISYPVLCVIQKKGAKIHQGDNELLELRAKIIKKIDYFWIYEIQ